MNEQNKYILDEETQLLRYPSTMTRGKPGHDLLKITIPALIGKCSKSRLNSTLPSTGS